MNKTYCDICGEEIASLDKACRYKIKKLDLSFFPYSNWERLIVHKVCWQNLVKLIAERREEHAYHT